VRASTWRELRGEARDRRTQVGMTVATKGVPLTCTMISIPLMILCHTAGDQTAAEPTLSVAGTMVWSKRIVMAHLQGLRFALCSDERSIPSWSCPRLASPTTKQGECHSWTIRGRMEKGLQGRDFGDGVGPLGG
jgi:hypothetical protein